MDPKKYNEIPRFQIGWIDNVCYPLINVKHKIHNLISNYI
jgi:hypothetical protein